MSSVYRRHYDPNANRMARTMKPPKQSQARVQDNIKGGHIRADWRKKQHRRNISKHGGRR